MWTELPEEQKKRYKTLITNFASLSEAFSQKTEAMINVAPIVNSKFQETAFQKCFNALSEDIANTSYDVSLELRNGNKYLVGIKAFGFASGDQKIAQFKSSSVADDWINILNEIKKNAKKATDKHQADCINTPLYHQLAVKIATLRNARIASSEAQIKGFLGTDKQVKTVYHVLMTSDKKQTPQIFVGETSYKTIDTKNLQVIGSTTKKNPTNFKFHDNQHTYKYTSADSQLLMTFNNKDIVLEQWNVEYIDDPFSVFENLHTLIKDKTNKIVDSISWMIPNNKRELEQSSGFNAFDGTTKLGKTERKQHIENISNQYRTTVNNLLLEQIIQLLEQILLIQWTQKKTDIQRRKTLRNKLMSLAEKANHDNLTQEIIKLVYRSATEVYIPIPESKAFHNAHPDFFGKDIGTFIDGTAKLKLPKELRTFKLVFLSSGNEIEAYINQDNGKAIQSRYNQDILGRWLLQEVFQLDEREPLTARRLSELGINSIRLSKFADETRGIGIEFIWIDVNNPPKDAIGWVVGQKK